MSSYKSRTQASLQVLLRGKQLLVQKPRRRSKNQQADADSIAGVFGLTVAQFNMYQLAGAAKDLVALSGIGKQPNTHPSNLGRLWELHTWLLQHQLLDGRGLTGLLTEQQLLAAENAAQYSGK